MSNQFNIGDNVVLNSGGPLMTVTGYKKVMNPESGKWQEQKDYVECSWFDNDGQLKVSLFPIASISIEQI